ncbi:MAG: NosD domain-containing protein [Candidatus Thorarchaeota archaeon]
MKRRMSLKFLSALSLCILAASLVFVSSNIPVIDESFLRMENEFELAYTPHDAIWITSNQEMIDQAELESWPGNGSTEAPFVISGFSFIQDTQPLRIWNTDLHWIFTGNLVDGDGGGVQCGTWIQEAENGVIHNNIFRNRHSGLALIDITNVNVTNNIVYSNSGFGFDGTSMMRDCNISGNTFYECGTGGINVASGAINCTFSGNTIRDCGGSGISLTMLHSSIVSFNTISNTVDFGIQIFGSTSDEIFSNIINQCEDGIFLKYTDFTQVYNNTISNCLELGFSINSGENSTIEWNTIQNNLGYGIHLDSGVEYFEVKFNSLLDNGVDCQICDDSIGSRIYCNYYSDWNSPDEDSNGFVDIPYVIDGSAENEDLFPLAEMGIVPSMPSTTTNENDIPLGFDPLVVGIAALGIVVVVVFVIVRKRVA